LSRPLRAGDVVNIDVTAYLDGYHGDTSRTFFVGTPSPNAKRLVEANQEALDEAIKVCAAIVSTPLTPPALYMTTGP
jgi:methionyl aminopeptidase